MPGRRVTCNSGFGRIDVVNALCLAFIVALLAAPFVSSLGFYSDDWALLAKFQADLDAGRFGLGTMLRGFESRPLQGIQLAGQFYLFGLNPLAHHIVNTGVLAAALVAFHLLLVRMGTGRRLAFAAAAILAVLPQLSTARVWYATFQVPLSLLLTMLSLHAQLGFARSGRWWLLVGACVAALASIAAYEIFAPLILGFPAWLIVRAQGDERRRSMALGIGAFATVALAVAAKYLLTDRGQSADLAMYMEGLRRLVKPTYDWRIEGSLNIFATLDVNLWQPFAGMAKGAAALFGGELGIAAAAAGVAVASIALWRLDSAGEPSRGGASTALLVGIAAFLLAHTPFLISSQVMFAPTGIANRTLVGMAIGVALMIAGVLALLPPRLFVGAVGLLVLTAAWRTEHLYSYWAQGWAIEQRLAVAARQDLRQVPANSAVIFDGVCPYHGPAIVLETWEAAGMLSLALGRPMRADTSSDRMKITDQGLTTEIYDEQMLYPYGPDLYVYDAHRRLIVPLPDRASAERYFVRSDRRRQCPRGYIGQGVLI